MDDAYQRALDELGGALAQLDEAQVDAAVSALAAAQRIVLYGVGREGLQVRGLAMRLHHLGLHAAVAGDMTAPPVGPGDLLMVSAGPGAFSTVLALMGEASAAGARTLVVTARDGEAARRSDLVLLVPAQTMADDLGADDLGADDQEANKQGGLSVLPMGSLYEGALYILFEVIVLRLRDRLGVPPDAMRARHTNLE